MRRTSLSSDLLVLGGGVGGCFLAALLGGKRKSLVVEAETKEPTLLKRIKVSGNGRCNFFNANLLDPQAALPFLEKTKRFFYRGEHNYPQETLDFLVKELGIAYFREGDLFYPFFNRSECVMEPLLEFFGLSKSDVLHGRVLSVDRKRHVALVRKEDEEIEISYRDVVLALGGQSYDRSPNDRLLASLDVPFLPFSPSLCPVRVEERIPAYLVGNRLRSRVRLLADGKEVGFEDGEVLFKEDGLSGISVFNLSLLVNECLRRNEKKRLVFEIDYGAHDGYIGREAPLSAFPLFLRRYLSEKGIPPFERLCFTFKSLYPFKNSQVSFGGLLPESFDADFTLRKDPSFHAIGECLDIGLPCGGYNIGFALTSAFVLGQSLRR